MKLVDTGVLPTSTSSTLTIAPGGFEEIVIRRCTHPHSKSTTKSRLVISGDKILDTEIYRACIWISKETFIQLNLTTTSRRTISCVDDKEKGEAV